MTSGNALTPASTAPDVRRVGRRTRRKSRGSDRRRTPWIFYALATLGLTLLTIPAIIIILAGLSSGTYLEFPPQGFSLRWVRAFLSGGLLQSYIFSLELAAVATAVATALGLLVSLYLARTKSRGRAYVRAYFLAPLTLPAVVFGFALYVFYIQFVPALTGTFVGLAIGHVIVCTPYVIAVLSGALAGLDDSLEQAARSLGASAWSAFRRVTLPLIVPGIVSSAVFAFVVSFGQFEVSLFLGTPNHQPIPIALYQASRFKFDPTIAGAGVFAIGLVVVSMLVLNHLFGLQKLLTVRLN